jgi:hypothetical protein
VKLKTQTSFHFLQSKNESENWFATCPRHRC